VALALLGLLPQSIDLVISGINPNANLGHDVTYSGTVTAAMEAVIAGVPGLAISLDTPEDWSGGIDYSTSAQVAEKITRKVMTRPLPTGVLLNVNVPYRSIDRLAGIMMTRQGLRIYRDQLVRREDPRGKPYYWIGGEAPTGVPDDGTDFGALARGYVSITPLKLDLTAHELVREMASWQEW
jgi:5'-nucleotidase